PAAGRGDGRKRVPEARAAARGWGGPGGPAGRRVRPVLPLVLVAALLAGLLAATAPGPGPARAAGFDPGWPALAPAQPLPPAGQELAAPGGAGQSQAPAVTAGEAGEVPAPWRGLVPPPPAISSAAAVLVDAASGQVLYQRNARQRRPPASTTKIQIGRAHV